MDVYKCIVAKLPKARTAVFRKFQHFKDIEFLYFKLDDEHPYFDESPYLEASLGDSGNGFWTDSFIGTKYRKTIVAVMKAGYLLKPLSDFSPNDPNPKAKHQCRMFATKVTDEIVSWIKEKAGI